MNSSKLLRIKCRIKQEILNRVHCFKAVIKQLQSTNYLKYVSSQFSFENFQASQDLSMTCDIQIILLLLLTKIKYKHMTEVILFFQKSALTPCYFIVHTSSLTILPRTRTSIFTTLNVSIPYSLPYFHDPCTFSTTSPS